MEMGSLLNQMPRKQAPALGEEDLALHLKSLGSQQ